MKTKDEHALEAKDPYVLKVLLAYDNARTCRAMLDMLNRVSTRLRAQAQINVNAFRFGLLEEMDPLQWPAAGQWSAELAVVAFGEAGLPGAGLLRWLENWGKCHAHKQAALGLVPLAKLTSQSVRRIVRTLRATAARHGLDFIYAAASPLDLFQTRGTVVA